MYNLVDLFSISLLILITLFIALRWPAVSKIIIVALAIRILFLFINNHIFYLPDGDMDAKNFEQLAWEFSHDSIYNDFNYSIYNNFISYGRAPHTYFLSFLISVPYSLLGRSILLAQVLSILFGIGSVFLG